MTGDNKNLILAIVLSVLVIGAYHFLYLAPQAAKQAELARQQAEIAEQAKQTQTQQQGSGGGQVPGPRRRRPSWPAPMRSPPRHASRSSRPISKARSTSPVPPSTICSSSSTGRP